MLKNQLIISIACLGLVVSVDSLLAQDVPESKTIVGDGPYEIEGHRIPLGYIIATAGAMATFQPCTGRPFPVEREKLKRTSRTCNEEASPETNPVRVTCQQQQQDTWSLAGAELMAMSTTATVGTAWVENAAKTGTGAIEVLSTHTVSKELENSAGLATCEDFLVIVDKQGNALANIIQTKAPPPAQ